MGVIARLRSLGRSRDTDRPPGASPDATHAIVEGEGEFNHLADGWSPVTPSPSSPSLGDYLRKNDNEESVIEESVIERSVIGETLYLESARQSLLYVLCHIEDGFEARMGVPRSDVERLLDGWPQIDGGADSPHVGLAINNALREVCDGLRIADDRWSRWFTVSREDVSKARQWASTRRWTLEAAHGIPR